MSDPVFDQKKIPFKISRAVVLSVLCHVLFVGALIYLGVSSRSTRLAKWSGGSGDQPGVLAYVDLGSVPVIDGEDSYQIQQANDRSLDQAGKIPVGEKVSSATQKNKPPESRGTGSSDTPAGGVGEGLDAEGFISESAPNVLAQIRKKIMQNKTYPLMAKHQGWTGIVKVAFQVTKSGELKFVRIEDSSGYAVLDEAAVQTVKKAAPLPYYPGVIALALEYQLR